MVVIRLSRGGTKKRPFYQIRVADKKAPRDGRFIEGLGFYNPQAERDTTDRLTLDLDRLSFWEDNGAQMSDRVKKLKDIAIKMETSGLANKKMPAKDTEKAKSNIEKRQSNLKEN